MMPPNDKVKHILQEWELAPKKRFGQNFLIHSHSASRIVAAADLTGEDTILEIGVGFGALTRPLAARAKKIIGLEIDAGIIRWHETEGRLPKNVSLIHQDVLKFDFRRLAAKLGKKLKIIANLPYSISNPLLFKLIENHDVVEWAVLMLQKEVGERLFAPIGSKAYGVLSILVKACADVTPLMGLGPANFHPRPKVDSLVLRIRFDPVPDFVKGLPRHNKKLLRKLVNAAFQQRRKTLLNALSSGNLFGLDKQETQQLLEKSGISPLTRGERLSVEEFVRLAIAFNEKGIET